MLLSLVVGFGVSVLNDKLQPMFIYPTSDYERDVRDSTFDSAGHLLIVENNNNIHIIDATTGDLEKIVPVKDYPTCLTTYSCDSVVMCSFFLVCRLVSMKYLG